MATSTGPAVGRPDWCFLIVALPAMIGFGLTLGPYACRKGFPHRFPRSGARFTHSPSEGSSLLPTSYRHRFTPNALRAAKRSIPDRERENILHGVTNLHVGLEIHYPEYPPVPALTLRVLSISQGGSVLLGLPEESVGMS